MLKKEAIPPTIACKIEAMPLTMAMRHAPIVWQRERMQDTTAPIMKVARFVTLSYDIFTEGFVGSSRSCRFLKRLWYMLIGLSLRK